MKTRAYLLYIVVLVTCIVAFSVPFLVVGSTSQKLYASDLVILNTGAGSATPTLSGERALTVTAFAALFITANNSPTATITSTSVPSPTPVFTSTLPPTLAASSTPTVAPSPTPIPPTITSRPRDRATPTSPPSNQPPGDPPPTNPPPTDVPPTKTNPPPTAPPATNPPPTDLPSTDLPLNSLPIINTVIPPLLP